MAIVYANGKSPGDVAERLRAMRTRAGQLAPVMKQATIEVQKMISDGFRSAVGPGGDRWAPNAPSTIRAKGSAKPNIDIATLKDSIAVAVIAAGQGISFGTNVPYAGPVQWGHTRSGKLKNTSYTNGVKREKGTAWTSTTVARAFLPFLRDGSLMQTGRALRVFGTITKMVASYISTGKLEDLDEETP